MTGDPISPAETVYRTSAAEFELSRIEIGAGTPHIRRTTYGLDALITLAGPVTMTSAGHTVTLDRGDAILASDGENYFIEAGSVRGRLFKASVPDTSG